MSNKDFDFINDLEHTNLSECEGELGLSESWTVNPEEIMNDSNEKKLFNLINDKSKKEFDLSDEQAIDLAVHIKRYGFKKLDKLNLDVNIINKMISRLLNSKKSMESADSTLAISIASKECYECNQNNPDVVCCKDCKLFDLKKKSFDLDYSYFKPCKNCSKYQKQCSGIYADGIDNLDKEFEMMNIKEMYDEINVEYYVILDTLEKIGINKLNERLYNAIKKQIEYYEGKHYSLEYVIKLNSNNEGKTIMSVLQSIWKVTNALSNEILIEQFDLLQDNTDKKEKVEINIVRAKNALKIYVDDINVADINKINNTVYIYTNDHDFQIVKENAYQVLNDMVDMDNLNYKLLGNS